MSFNGNIYLSYEFKMYVNVIRQRNFNYCEYLFVYSFGEIWIQ